MIRKSEIITLVLGKDVERYLQGPIARDLQLFLAMMSWLSAE